MPRVVLLSSEREPGGPASVLPARLPRDRFFLHVAELLPGRARSWTQAAGQIVALAPHVVHAVGWPAAGVALAVQAVPRRGGTPRPRIVITPSSQWPKAAGRSIRWMMRRADLLLPRTNAERDCLLAAGAEVSRVEVISPAVEESPTPTGDRRSRAGIAPDVPLIVALGDLEDTKGLTTAVWAFDVLKYAHPTARMVVLGDGPERPRAEQFARRVGFDDFRVRFAPRPADAPGWLGAADSVWVAANRGSVGHALRGLAVPKPVVLAVPGAAKELATRDDSARAVPAGGRVELAVATRELLGRREELAATAAARAASVRERFAPAAIAARLAAAYDALAARP